MIEQQTSYWLQIGDWWLRATFDAKEIELALIWNTKTNKPAHVTIIQRDELPWRIEGELP